MKSNEKPMLSQSLSNSEPIAQNTDKGKGSSPIPPVLREVWQLLDGGLASLDLNDHGYPWPAPRRSALIALCSRYPEDLCLKAAKEAREIVQSQDRAPNITGLFAKKLEDLAKVRETVREVLGEEAV